MSGGQENPDGPKGPRQDQVDKWGTLFARILDKRDGTGSQEAVDEAVNAIFPPDPTAALEAPQPRPFAPTSENTATPKETT